MNGVYESFLQSSLIDAMELAEQSDGRMQVFPQAPLPPSRYGIAFKVPFLRQLPSGMVDVVTTEPLLVGLSFPEWYLRSADPHLLLSIISVITPRVLHPNVRGSLVCMGDRLVPGTPLRLLLFSLYEVIGYRNLGLDERNALAPDACRFLRAHPDLLARLMAPPLRSRRSALSVTMVAR
jgi:hypothetical protein